MSDKQAFLISNYTLQGAPEVPLSKSLLQRLFLIQVAQCLCNIEKNSSNAQNIARTALAELRKKFNVYCTGELALDVSYSYKCAEDILYALACNENPHIYVGESATSFRFYAVCAAYFNMPLRIGVAPGLARRSHADLLTMQEHFSFNSDNLEEFLIVTPLPHTDDILRTTVLPMKVGSQVASALLMCHALHNSLITHTFGKILKLEQDISLPYIDLSCWCIGAQRVLCDGQHTIELPTQPQQVHHALNTVDARLPHCVDASSYALWYGLSRVNNDQHIDAYEIDPHIPDAQALEYIEHMKAFIACDHNENFLKISLQQCPDLCYVFVLCAAYLVQNTEKRIIFTHMDRLAHKECNRFTSCKELLAAFNVSFRESVPYELEILPSTFRLHTRCVCVHNDHRLAMAYIMGMGMIQAPHQRLELDDVLCIQKSYPRFINVLYDMMKATT